MRLNVFFFFFFSSRRRHTRSYGDWSSDVCSSDLRGVVCKRDRILVRACGEERGDRAEDLLANDPAGRRQVGQHRRLYEVATAVVRATTADKYARCLALSDVEVTEHRVELALRGEGLHLRLLVERIADRPRPCDGRESIAEFLQHLLFYDDAARRRALLSRREERAACDLLDRELQISIGEDDGGVLAAELELHLLPCLGCLQFDRASDRVRPGEGDCLDAIVRDERVT